jgi:hypothetical protein
MTKAGQSIRQLSWYGERCCHRRLLSTITLFTFFIIFAMTQELVANTQAEAAATKTITVLSTTNTTITVHTETNVTSSISVIKEEKIDKESKLYKQCLLFPTYAYWSSRVGTLLYNCTINNKRIRLHYLHCCRRFNYRGWR